MDEKGSEYIDQLFRDGLTGNHHQHQFRERDWEKLESRLDRHEDRKRIVYWLRPLGGVAALILLAVAGWWVWPEKKQTVPPEIAVVQDSVKKEQERVDKPNYEVASIPAAEASTGKSRASETPAPKQERAPALGGGKSITFNDNNNSSNGVNNNAEQQAQAHRGEMNLISPLSGQPYSEENLTVELKQKQHQAASMEKVLPSPVKIKSVAPLKLEDEPQTNNLAFTAMAAPSYNGVNNLNNAKIGGDFGLLFSVAVSKRWSLSTGAIYALKLYTADGNSYNPSADGGYVYSPSSVDADCRVLDVPLNVDYQLLNFPKTSLSLGTGISSYFMLSEKYSYHYAYGPEQKNAVSLKNNSIHWLSVLNFQASLERQLSPRIGISVRPYMKMPIQDIGYGRVKLQSFGVALATSFNF